jgi:hypothetical protein
MSSLISFLLPILCSLLDRSTRRGDDVTRDGQNRNKESKTHGATWIRMKNDEQGNQK